MKITQEEIASIFPVNNWVLIRPKLEVGEIQTKSGIKLFVDTTYKPEHHSRVLGEVVSVPKQLIFSKKHRKYSMEWETESNIRIGETVIINYLAGLNAEKYHYIMFGEEKLFLVPYAKIYMVIRNNEPIMLNGYVLVERDKGEKLGDLDVVDRMAERTGIIRYLHEPNTAYLDKSYDDDMFKVGDRVLLAYKNYKTLENDLHRIFSKKELLVMQRYQIAAKI